jgi:hypothetical protein
MILRADSAFYSHDVIAAARRAKVRFWITARMSSAVTTAISGINQAAWPPISYPNTVWDDDEQRLISDAQIAEIDYTACTSRRTADHIEGRLIVRRVTRLNPNTKAPTGTGDAGQQQELFTAYRYRRVHRQPAGPGPGRAGPPRPRDRRAGPRRPQARAAGPPSLRVVPVQLRLARAGRDAFNLTGAAGCLASLLHARATTGTIRAQLINVPARLAHSGRRLHLHFHGTGPGNAPGPSCSTPPWDHPSRPDPLHLRKARHEPKWNSRTDRPITHAPATQHDQQAAPTGPRDRHGGSRFKGSRTVTDPHEHGVLQGGGAAGDGPGGERAQRTNCPGGRRTLRGDRAGGRAEDSPDDSGPGGAHLDDSGYGLSGSRQ